jgi:hypothetical protein
MSEPTLAARVAAGELDADLVALVWLLAESGVPLTVASDDPDAARELRAAVGALMPDHHASDLALAGGSVRATSLEQVLAVLGGSPGAEIDDAARDLGVVLVLADGHVTAAHYVRPVERDAAGHLQRRPPALLSAWNDGAARHDNFYWAITDELATRAGMAQADFEAEHRLRSRRLRPAATGGSSTAPRH